MHSLTCGSGALATLSNLSWEASGSGPLQAGQPTPRPRQRCSLKARRFNQYSHTPPSQFCQFYNDRFPRSNSSFYAPIDKTFLPRSSLKINQGASPTIRFLRHVRDSTGPTSLGRAVRLCQCILSPPQISIRDLTFLVHQIGTWSRIAFFFGTRDA